MEELSGYVVLDLETSITTYLKRKASPFTDENWIVAAGWSFDGAKPEGAYYGMDKRGADGLLATLLAGNPRFLVGFNIKFDLLHLLRCPVNYAAWQAWVEKGGLVFCTQLAEYLLMGQVQEAHMLSLDEVAPKYGGNVKIDEVKVYWNQGINTPEIPRDLLMDYLLGRGDVEGDIGNTRAVFLGQVEKAKASGQAKSIQLNMGALCCSIEMERNGMFVNKAKGLALAEKLRQRINSLTQSLLTYLPTGLPFEFNWRSRVHLSALIFGGSVTYVKRVQVRCADTNEPMFSMMDEVQPVLDETGKPVLFASGKNAGQPKTRKVKVPDPSKPKMHNEEFEFSFKGFVKPRKEWLGATPGVYSTAGAVIEELAATSDIPFLKEFGELQAKTKDLGTYYLTEELDDGGNVKSQKGMLTLVDSDGIVHHKINHTSTVTGRFSSNDPNLQNLPHADKTESEKALTGDASEVKTMFESRFSDGNIVSSDFKSLEVYCQAQLTGDRQLIADLQAGLDMHVARLSTAEGKDYDEVLRLCKIDEVPEWVSKRTNIKVFSFQRAYGAGAKKIASFLKKPVELVESWIVADEARYSGVVNWQNRVAEKVKLSRVPTSRFVRHPDFPHITCQIGRGEYRTFDGKRYVFFETPAQEWAVRKGEHTSFMPTELKNYPVQGLGGEWMKAAMWLLVRAFYRYKNFGDRALLCNTVHDAAYADAAPEVTQKAALLMHSCMEAASDLMEYWFDTTIVVPVPSDTSYGPSMAIEKGLKPDAAVVSNIRASLRAWYMESFEPSYL